MADDKKPTMVQRVSSAVRNTAAAATDAVNKAAPGVLDAVGDAATATGRALLPMIEGAADGLNQATNTLFPRPNPILSEYDFLNRAPPGRPRAAMNEMIADPGVPRALEMPREGEVQTPAEIEKDFRRMAGLPQPVQAGRWPELADVRRASDLPPDSRTMDPRPARAYMPYAEHLTGAPADYLVALKKKENPFDVRGDSGSGASGPFQFIRDTWEATVRAHGEKEGLPANMNRDDLWAKVEDPRWATVMAAHHQVDNATALRASIGRNPSWGEVYLGHFSGVDRAARLILADQGKPATAHYSAKEIAGNAPSFYPSLGRGRYDYQRPYTVAQHIKYHAGAFPNREWTQYGPTTPRE